jgi:transposase
MEHLAVLVQQIEKLDQQILAKVHQEGFQKPFELLQTIPGLQQVSAAEALAEVGPLPHGRGSVPDLAVSGRSNRRAGRVL